MQRSAGQSFAQIYQSQGKLLKSYLQRRGVKPEDCDDIVQETFLRCYKILMDKAVGEPSCFLKTVARNLHIDLYRRQRKYPLANDMDCLEGIASDLSQSQKLAQKIMIERLIEEVTDQHDSRFFKMHYSDGLKLQEIATMTGTPLGTVTSQVARFRQRFQSRALHRLEAEVVFSD